MRALLSTPIPVFAAGALSALVLCCTPRLAPGEAASQAEPTPKPTQPQAEAPVAALPSDAAEAAAKPAQPQAEAPLPAQEQAPQATAPELVAEDGTSLPQTEEKPSFESAWLKASVRQLFAAITADNAEQAMSFYFPKRAYAQVKAIENPDRDWETRLWRSFTRDVHEYHLKLGKDRSDAHFIELRVNPHGVKWIKPGEEGNKVGYFRVLRSVLVYTDKQGRSRELGLLSMISWRGEWYVVHLARV